MAIPALALWALTASGAVETWMVLALVFVRGAVNAHRQPRAPELRGRDGRRRPRRQRGRRSTASSSTPRASSARRAAGAVIALLGVAPCFLLNALSFVAMLVALRGMDPRRARRPRRSPSRERGQLRSALRYVRAHAGAADPAGDDGPGRDAVLQLPGPAAAAGEASPGTATRDDLRRADGRDGRRLGRSARSPRARAGASSPRLLAAPPSASASPMLLAARRADARAADRSRSCRSARVSVTFAAGVNSTLQLAVEPAMRGRVMALYSVVFLGSTPIGAPLVGWLAGAGGPAGAASCSAASRRWSPASSPGARSRAARRSRRARPSPRSPSRRPGPRAAGRRGGAGWPAVSPMHRRGSPLARGNRVKR